MKRPPRSPAALASRAWMPRQPEPELMDDASEVRAYRETDFSEVNGELADRVIDLVGGTGRAVDLGTGPASIPVELCRRAPGWRVLGVDLGPRMLAEARRIVQRAGLRSRISFLLGDACRVPRPSTTFDLVLSNSLLHHLPDPLALWREATRLARSGGAIVVQDLLRPPSPAAASRIVERHAADASTKLRELFHQSLLAAYRVDEVEAQLGILGLDGFRVEAISDRHLLVCGGLEGRLR